MHRNFCTEQLSHTQKYLHTQAFTLYTQNLLHREDITQTEVVPHRSFCTEKLLHREAFTQSNFHRSIYTQKPLHTDTEVFTQGSFYTQTHLHREVFTQRRFYTQKLLHRETFTDKLFYNNSFVRIPAQELLCKLRCRIVGALYEICRR